MAQKCAIFVAREIQFLRWLSLVFAWGYKSAYSRVCKAVAAIVQVAACCYGGFNLTLVSLENNKCSSAF